MDIYYTSISSFPDLTGSELLLPVRRSRLEKYFRLDDKKRSLAAGLLLRAVLGQDASLEVETDRNGKPFLKGGPQFNISHSGNYVVLAVDTEPLGTDVEEFRPYSESVAERCFTPEEQDWLRSLESKERAFYTLWTGKESVMKATGKGFRMPPENFTVFPVHSGEHIIDGKKWYLNWRVVDDHIVCTASARSPKEIRLIELDHGALLAGGLSP